MALNDTTIRDFGGGWNVADSDVNLESRYQPISDNVRRGLDGSLSARYGYAMFADMKQGTQTNFTTAAYSCVTTTGNPTIEITMTAHGKASGDTITILTCSGPVGGIPASQIINLHQILVIDANKFRIVTRVAATANATTSLTISGYFTNHVLGGNIIHMHYFNRKLVVFDDVGQVATVDAAGTITRIWDYAKSNALVGNPTPWGPCELISTTTFKSTLIAVNGYDKDKPISIDTAFAVTYLDDAGTGSNANVPKADYVLGMSGYVIMVRPQDGAAPFVNKSAYVSISAKNTDGVFVGNPTPVDACEIDLSMITDTTEPTLLGCGPLRDKLYVGFYDKGMLGTLSVYNELAKHTPDFEDTIAEHGVIAHRTIVPLGNDIFMTDYAGVPSVSISAQSGVFVPTRLSDLISPEMSRHLASLKEETLRKKAFAIYNKTEREYMLFVPKYDATVRTLPVDPFFFNSSLREKNLAYVYHPNHNLMDRSTVTIAGATAIGSLTAAMINGVRPVVAIFNKNAYIVQLGGPLIENDITNGGGAAVTVTPVNDETIGYVYEYNKDLKIRRWTRYRDLNFGCGAVSQRGIIYLATTGRIFQFGTKENPIYADAVGDYDKIAWANNTSYTTGERVRDADDKQVYICLSAHLSASSGTFAQDREDRPEAWKLYPGEAIFWEAETPWSDFKKRGQEKHIVYINLDTDGKAEFDVSVFSNGIRIHPDTGLLSPARTMTMTSGQISGFGGLGVENQPPYGSGRRTREDRVWPFDVRGKLIRFRYSGATVSPFRLIAHTIYYFVGSVRR